MNNNDKIHLLIKEELTKTEITNIVMSKLSSELSGESFERKIKKIAAKVVEELFKTLWQKRSFWQNDIKK